MRMLESEGRDVGKWVPNQGCNGFCWEVHMNDAYLMLKSLAIYGKSSRGLLKSIISGGFGGNPQLWRRHGYMHYSEGPLPWRSASLEPRGLVCKFSRWHINQQGAFGKHSLGSTNSLQGLFDIVLIPWAFFWEDANLVHYVHSRQTPVMTLFGQRVMR